MNKIELLQILKEKVVSCTKCPELASTRIQTVFGNGNPYSRLMIIAEAPGADENKEGEPLIGRAGKLLNNILASVGIDRKDVYVCNVLKCRPPGNRKPIEIECANCEPFLDYQIKIVKPEFILCLGNVAAQNLLKTDLPISILRGKWHDLNGIKVLPTYHPAYLLRNPEAKRDVQEDLKLLLREL